MLVYCLTVFIELLEDLHEFFWRKSRVAVKFQDTGIFALTFTVCHVSCPQDQNNIRVECEPALVLLCTSLTHARYGFGYAGR